MTADSMTADSMTGDLQAWQDVLAAEHAALWGYGLVGATPPLAPPAQQAQRAHRERRTRCIDAVVALGGEPVASAAAYQIEPPDDATDAREVAAQLEEACQAAYAALAGAEDRASRLRATRWLRESAISQWRWSGAVPTFPGLD
jgi:sugar phosphate isomerase/epimerase